MLVNYFSHHILYYALFQTDDPLFASSTSLHPLKANQAVDKFNYNKPRTSESFHLNYKEINVIRCSNKNYIYLLLYTFDSMTEIYTSQRKLYLVIDARCSVTGIYLLSWWNIVYFWSNNIKIMEHKYLVFSQQKLENVNLDMLR